MLQLKFNGILIITGHGSQSQSSNLFNFVSVFLTENNQTTSFSNNLQMFKSMLNLYILANLDQPQVFRVLLWIEPNKWSHLQFRLQCVHTLITLISLLRNYFSLLRNYFSLLRNYFCLLRNYFSLLRNYFNLLRNFFIYSGTILVYFGTILVYSRTILVYFGTILVYSGKWILDLFFLLSPTSLPLTPQLK